MPSEDPDHEENNWTALFCFWESQPTNQRCALLQEMIRNQQDFQCIYVTISNFESHSKCRQCKPMMERYIWFHFVLLTFWLKRARDQWYLITVYSLIGQFQLNLSLVKFTVNVWEYFYSPSFVFHSLPEMSKCFFRPKNQSFSWFCLLDGFLLDINSIAQLVLVLVSIAIFYIVTELYKDQKINWR